MRPLEVQVRITRDRMAQEIQEGTPGPRFRDHFPVRP